jgi:hypothetical protein
MVRITGTEAPVVIPEGTVTLTCRKPTLPPGAVPMNWMGAVAPPMVTDAEAFGTGDAGERLVGEGAVDSAGNGLAFASGVDRNDGSLRGGVARAVDALVLIADGSSTWVSNLRSLSRRCGNR